MFEIELSYPGIYDGRNLGQKSSTKSMSSTNRTSQSKRKSKYLPEVQQVRRGSKLYRQSRKGIALVAILKDGMCVSSNGVRVKRNSLSTMKVGSNLTSLQIKQNSSEWNKYVWSTVAEIEEYSSRKTLLLDFDMATPVPSLIPFLARLRVIGLRAGWCSYRRTRKGWHVAIGIDVALTPSEQVACQFALGSDPQRETMNTRRALCLRLNKVSPFWRKRWNILFLRKL